MTEKNERVVTSQRITLRVSDGTEMPAYVARPVGDASRGILVYQEAFGVNHHIRDVADRFAREGYVAIAPALYHRTDPEFEGSYTDFGNVMPHMQAITEDNLTADIRAASAWLTSAEGANTDRTVAVGYCLGGRVAFQTVIVAPVRAAACYYGGGIAPNPARNMPGLLEQVGALHAPVLLVWGGKDAHMGPDVTRAVDDALIAANKTHASITFSDADHGFFCDARASYNPDAARQAWALTLAFFESYL